MRYCSQVAFGWVQHSHTVKSLIPPHSWQHISTHTLFRNLVTTWTCLLASLFVNSVSSIVSPIGGPFPRHILPEVSSAALCRESNLPPALLGNHKLRIAAIFIQRALCHRITAINLLMTSHLRNLRPYCNLALYSGLRLISCNQKE